MCAEGSRYILCLEPVGYVWILLLRWNSRYLVASFFTFFFVVEFNFLIPFPSVNSSRVQDYSATYQNRHNSDSLLHLFVFIFFPSGSSLSQPYLCVCCLTRQSSLLHLCFFFIFSFRFLFLCVSCHDLYFRVW